MAAAVLAISMQMSVCLATACFSGSGAARLLFAPFQEPSPEALCCCCSSSSAAVADVSGVCCS
jgi:hypothetical protein